MKRTAIGMMLVAIIALIGAFQLERDQLAGPTILPIAFPTNGIAGEPHLTKSPEGLVYASWIERREDNAFLMMSSLKGEAWTDAKEISSGTNWFVNWADVPTLTVAAEGRMMAHWLEKLGDGKYAYGVRYTVSQDAGKSWTAPRWVHEDRSESEHGFASVVAVPTGFVAIWLDGSGYAGPEKAMALHGRPIEFDGTLGLETVLSSRACDCCPTALTQIGDGRLVALFRGRTSEEIRDIQATFWENGSWSTPTTMYEDDWKINACPVNGPSIHAEGQRFVSSWFTASGGAPRVNASMSDNRGLEFGEPLQIDLGQPVGRVAARMRTASQGAVLWIEGSGSSPNGLLLRTVDQDGSMSEPIQVAPISEGRSSGYPRMEVDGESLVVMWTAATEPATIQTARVLWN